MDFAGVYIWSDGDGKLLRGSVCYRCVVDRTVKFVRYCGAGTRTVTPGVSGCSIALDYLVWSNGTLFLVAAAWRHSVWVMVMVVGMLGLILIWVG